MNAMAEVRNVYEKLSATYDIVAVLGSGSQFFRTSQCNTGIMDTVAIAVPSLDDLISNNWVNREAIFKFGTCNIRDIRDVAESIKTQNVIYVGMLFSDIYIVNPKYQAYFDQLIRQRELLARLNEAMMVHSLYDRMIRKLKILAESRDSHTTGEQLRDYIDLIASANMASKYMQKRAFGEVIFCKELDRLEKTPLNYEKMLNQAQSLCESLDERANEYFLQNPVRANTRALRWLDDWAEYVIRKCCREDIVSAVVKDLEDRARKKAVIDITGYMQKEYASLGGFLVNKYVNPTVLGNVSGQSDNRNLIQAPERKPKKKAENAKGSVKTSPIPAGAKAKAESAVQSKRTLETKSEPAPMKKEVPSAGTVSVPDLVKDVSDDAKIKQSDIVNIAVTEEKETTEPEIISAESIIAEVTKAVKAEAAKKEAEKSEEESQPDTVDFRKLLEELKLIVKEES